MLVEEVDEVCDPAMAPVHGWEGHAQNWSVCHCEVKVRGNAYNKENNQGTNIERKIILVGRTCRVVDILCGLGNGASVEVALEIHYLQAIIKSANHLHHAIRHTLAMQSQMCRLTYLTLIAASSIKSFVMSYVCQSSLHKRTETHCPVSACVHKDECCHPSVEEPVADKEVKHKPNYTQMDARDLVSIEKLVEAECHGV